MRKILIKLKIKKNKPIKKIMLINFKEQETIPLKARSNIFEVGYFVSPNFLSFLL